MELDQTILASEGALIAEEGKWSIKHMVLTAEKTKKLWDIMQGYSTLFSDVTRNDYQNWVIYVTDPYTCWFEMYEDGALVGILHCEDMQQVYDTQAHIIIFDRRPASKIDGCRLAMRYLFDNFPLNRITVEAPRVYYATIRLAQ